MKHLITAVALLLMQVSISHGQEATQRTTHFNLENNLAIQGYDPVAYFKQNAAVKGSKDLAVFHQGVTYYFSSSANKEEFKKFMNKLLRFMFAGEPFNTLSFIN